MGITGLLQMLKPIQKPASISEFSGHVVGVDVYCWLHKGVYGCAMDLIEGKKTTVYVNYILRRVNLMLHHKIKPILVFDGGHLPSKADKERERRSLRKDNKAKGLAFLRAGNKVEAVECFQRCVDITPEMALDVIKACRAKGVDCVVAPYEADAQLAYLYKHGIIHLVISEDSDLLIYGCKKVLYKMDASGNGTLIDLDDLPKLTDLKLHQFSMEKFRHMCILSGCDYLPSVKGIGLITANKLLRKYSDVWKLLKSLKLGTQYSVSQEYVKHFKQADETFLYQTVFDPQSETLVPLTTIPEELQSSDLQFAGPLVSKEVAVGIALGNIDPISGDTMADFDQKVISPDTLNASSEESGGGGTRTGYQRHSLTPRPATSWDNSVMYGKGKTLNIQKNLGGLMMEFEPSELARKPFVPPQMTRKGEGKCEEDSLDNDQLADMYTSLKPKLKSNKSSLPCSSASNRKLPIRRSRFQNPFRAQEEQMRDQRNNQVSRYFKFRSSSHPEKEDHPHSAAVSPTSPEMNTQDGDNATENGLGESILDPGAALSRLSSNMPRLPCFVRCLEQDNEQDTFDRDSENKENLSGSTSSGSLETSLGMTTENCASPRSRKRKHSGDDSDCCSAVINHSDDNSSHGDTPVKHVKHCDSTSNTGTPNALKASALPVRKQVLQESNTLTIVNVSAHGESDTTDTKLCGHTVNLLTHFGYRRSNSRLQEEERPSATLDRSRLKVKDSHILNVGNTAQSKNVFESDRGYLSDEEESTDSDETASHLSSGCVSLTQSGSHPVHIDLSQDTEVTTSLQYSCSGTLQKGNSARTKTVKKHIQLRAKTGAARSTGLGRCRSMGITKKTARAAQRTPATPNTPNLFNYFEYSKRNMNK